MKASISWLKEYVDINVTVEQLCAKMVAIGFEIEGVEYLGKDISNVVVGQIIAIEKHPDADKLQICKVNIGSKTVQIVTGAKNIKLNDKVPVALDDARLPTGQTIKNGLLRGVESQGMMCSGSELCVNNSNYIGASVDGILILDSSEKIGANIVGVLGLDDYVLDVSVTSNRSDCNSIYGLAREIAVALQTKCKPLSARVIEESDDTIDKYVEVYIPAIDLCPNYFMNVVKDVRIEPSPLWMTRRLASVGHNSINNIVDITNYVLLEVGQPMHAFDHKDINEKTIVVRRAFDNEKMIPFDNKEYTLDANMLVIADRNRAVGLAGIMGGLNSGIKPDTSIVAFEAAKFARGSIRRTSKKLGLRSDSSARFEKGIDSYTTELGLNRALHLIKKLNCGTIVKGRISIGEEVSKPRKFQFKFDNIPNRLGIEINRDSVKKILDNLNIETSFEGDDIICIIPPYREDIERDCDIAEEVIRVYGYDNIQSTLLKNASITRGGKTELRTTIDSIKNTLCGLGLNEIITYSFGSSNMYEKLLLPSDKLIKLANPLGEELSLMRSTLVGNMLNVLATNISRKNPVAVLYEYARVYSAESLPLTSLPTETNMLSIGGYGIDFYELKQAAIEVINLFNLPTKLVRSTVKYLHPGISADVLVNDICIGSFGKVHPSVANNFQVNEETFVGELNIDKLFELRAKLKRYNPIPKFPSVNRDLAVVVSSGILVGEIIEVISQTNPIIESVSLLSIYTDDKLGVDKKSVALSIVLRANDRTLNEKEIEQTMEKALKSLSDKFDAKLR